MSAVLPLLTDSLAMAVEYTGSEFSVTLLVDGAVVCGILTPQALYYRWQSAYVRIADATGGGAIDATTEGPSQELQEELIAKNAARVEAAGLEPGSLVRTDQPTLCLRNAVIESGPAETWRTIPFLLIDAARVSALSFGVRMIPT